MKPNNFDKINLSKSIEDNEDKIKDTHNILDKIE